MKLMSNQVLGKFQNNTSKEGIELPRACVQKSYEFWFTTSSLRPNSVNWLPKG